MSRIDIIWLTERAIDWQKWTAASYHEAMLAMDSGDVDTAKWWQDQAAMDYTAMWSRLAQLLHCAVVQ